MKFAVMYTPTQQLCIDENDDVIYHPTLAHAEAEATELNEQNARHGKNYAAIPVQDDMKTNTCKSFTEIGEMFPEARFERTEGELIRDDHGYAVSMRGHYTVEELLCLARELTEANKFFNREGA